MVRRRLAVDLRGPVIRHLPGAFVPRLIVSQPWRPWRDWPAIDAVDPHQIGDLGLAKRGPDEGIDAPRCILDGGLAAPFIPQVAEIIVRRLIDRVRALGGTVVPLRSRAALRLREIQNAAIIGLGDSRPR